MSEPSPAPQPGHDLDRLMSPRLFLLILAGLVLLFMNRALFPPAGSAIGGLDVRGLFVPWLSFTRASLAAGHLPLWDSMQFAGYPFLSNPQAGVFYPPAWLALILPVNAAISWYIALHLWIAGAGMYLFICHQTGSRSGAALAGLAYAFSGFMAARIFAGHIGVIATDSWLPWLLLGLAVAVKRADLPAALLAGVPLGLAILAGHTTSLIYIALAWAGFVLFLLAKGNGLWPVLRQTAISIAAGLALSGIQLIPLVEFSLVSTRAAAPSLAFASEFSLPPAHLIGLALPEFFGEPTRAGYWSVPNFEELTYYVGILPLLAVVLALLRRPRPLSWYALGLAVVGLLLALGGYSFLFGIVYTLLPPFRVARAPARAAFLFVVAGCIWLGEAVGRWERHPEEHPHPIDRAMRWLLPVALGIGVLGLAASGAAFAALHPTETSGRLWHQIGGWGLATLFAGTAGALLWRYLKTPGSTAARGWLLVGLAAALLADLWTFGAKLTRLDSIAPIPLWSEARTLIGEPEGRVLPWGLSIFFQNGAGEVGLPSVFGYSALEVAATQRLAASIPDPRAHAYDILGVRYVVAGGPLDEFTDGERPLTLLSASGSAWVYGRARPMPLARLVTQAQVIPDPTAALAEINRADFDPTGLAVLDRAPPCAIDGGDGGEVAILEQRPGYWRIETESEEAALLILSETAYPGWQARVNGAPAEILTAYTAIRAICVPAGQAEVVVRYRPLSLWAGAALSGLALLAFGWAGLRTKAAAPDADRPASSRIG